MDVCVGRRAVTGDRPYKNFRVFCLFRALLCALCEDSGEIHHEEEGEFSHGGTEAQGKAGKTPRRSFLEGGFRGMLSRFPARFPDMLEHEQHARKRGGGNRMLPVRYGVRWQSAARHRFVRESQANARRRAFCANRKAASLPPHSKKT